MIFYANLFFNNGLYPINESANIYIDVWFINFSSAGLLSSCQDTNLDELGLKSEQGPPGIGL